jgi:ABC-type multidrug transport system fused ATPase/permease subunit
MRLPRLEHRRLLGAYLAPQSARVILLAGLLAAGIALQLLNPQVIRYFIDAAQTAGATRSLTLAALGYLVIGLARHGIRLAAAYVGMSVGWRATDALRSDLVRRCLRLDMPFHKSHTPGELIERIDGDATTLAQFFSQLVVRMAGNGLLILAILILLFREDGRAGTALTIYTAVTIAALIAVQKLGLARWIAARQAWTDLSGFLEERIGGVEDIRGIGAESFVLGQLRDRLAALLRKARGGWMARALSAAVVNFLYILGYGLGLAIGAYLYTQGAVTIGAAFVIVYYIGMLAEPLDAIRQEAEELQQATASIARITELSRVQPQVIENPRARLPDGPLSVSFEHVTFGYTDETGRIPHDGGDGALQAEPETPSPQADALPALTDVSFTVRPGRILGVLGRTGSGKTTLARLLARLYDPASGAIRLGDCDLRDLAFADLRQRVGMVTQDVQLFRGSVRDNIALFDPGVSDERIVQALAELGLTGWLESTLGGLDGELAAAGADISAGEAQLLAFVRVLLKEPGLVILDEAAARLDPITEARLERAIDRLLAPLPSLLAAHPRLSEESPRESQLGEIARPKPLGEKTAIIIAHRLATLQRADDILLLEGGRVVEFGPRARLAADPTSRFCGLLQTGLEEALA